MPARARANPLAMAVLACLYERPMHPYEVGQTLRSRAKHESVRLNFGSLYGVVDSLDKRGLVSPLETTREGRRPERTVYEITDAGRRELIDWMSDLVSTPAKEYPQFLAALSFIAVLPPEDALELLATRADALEVQRAQMRGVMDAAERAGLPRLFALEGEYELHQLESELEWLRRLIKDLSTDTFPGMDMWRSFHTAEGGPDFTFSFTQP